MTNQPKPKLLLITIFLLVLLSLTFANPFPRVQAAELTTQQKGLSVLSNVVGLDLAKYTVTTKTFQQNKTASYLGVIPQENIGYYLTSTSTGFNVTSPSTALNVLCAFANSNLQMMYVRENVGAPILTKLATSANAVDLAKGFLSNYRTYAANSLYGELISTLDNVDASKTSQN